MILLKNGERLSRCSQQRKIHNRSNIMKFRTQLAVTAALILSPVAYSETQDITDTPLLLAENLSYADMAAPEGNHIANALWSSTRTVRNFGRAALGQLDVYRGPWKEVNPSVKSGKGGQLTTVYNNKANVWLGGLGNWGKVSSTGDVDGYKYNGGGYSAGADYAFSNAFTGGLALGETFGKNKARWGYSSIDQRSLMIGTYGRYKTDVGIWNTLAVDGYFAYGSTRNKANMELGSSPAIPAHSKWDDNVFTAGLKFSWDIKSSEYSTWTPFFGIDYIHGKQDTANLTYGSGSQAFRDGNMQVWTIPVGITYKAVIPVGRDQFFIPEATVAYEGDVSRNNPSVRTDIMGTSVKTEGSNPGRHALLANAGARWVMNKNWSIGAYYTFEHRSRMTDHAVNGSLNYTF